MTDRSLLEGSVVAPGLPPGRYRIELSAGRIRRLDRLEPASSIPHGSQDAIDMLAEDEILLPGFVDAHTHLLGVGTARLKPNLRESASRSGALERLEAWLTANPGDDPVIAEGWDQSTWSDPTLPTRVEIDRITTRPVALRRVCGHIAVLNSAALATVGAGWDWVDYDSGLAWETLPLQLNRIWPRSVEMLDRAIEYAQSEAFRLGVTAIQEMGDPSSYRTYARAEAAGTLTLRVSHFFQLAALESVIGSGMTAGAGSETLRIGGIKLFLDGSIGGRTAALREPYAGGREHTLITSGAGSAMGTRVPAPNAAGELGTLLFSDDELARHLERCAKQDFPVALHGIGDRSIEQAVRVVERLAAQGVFPASPGPRLEHAEMLSMELTERAVSAGFHLSMQPNFTARWQHPGGLYEQMLGDARAFALNPYRDVYRTGRLLFGSDTIPLDPLLGLRGACCHPDPQQRLTLLEAIDAYTVGSARGVRSPFRSGRIEVNEPADFVALRFSPQSGTAPGSAAPATSNRPIETVASPESIGAVVGELLDRAVVSGTWIAGRCVHRLTKSEGALP